MMVRNYILFSIQFCYFILLVIRIRFNEEQLHEAQESSRHVSVVVSHDTISFATSFNVTITTIEFSGNPTTLTQDQSTATPNIGMTIIL